MSEPDGLRRDRIRRWAGRLVPWGLALLAGVPRFRALDLRPLHHDEGSNAIFLLRLVREGIYHYDPSNYHGPLPYYLGAVPILLFGATTIAFRSAPALLGTALAPLAWGLRGEIGGQAAAAAALLVAWSPSLVYYSRDNIHEIYLIFLTLLLVVAFFRGLRAGRLLPFIVAGAAAGGIVATKETAGVVFASLAFGFVVSGARGEDRLRAPHLAALAVAALFVAGAFYTRLFTERAGMLGPLEALRLWGPRAIAGDGHTKVWWYFPHLLAREEGGILALVLAGTGLAVARRLRFGLFVALWAGSSLAVYSAIPYKTPWLVLNMVLPLAILAGMAVGAAGASRRPRWRRAAAVALALAAAFSLRQAAEVSFVRYDDDGNPLVYVQTKRDALRLVARIEAAAARDPAGRAIPIQILSPDYLPLNWYLRDFKNVGYYGHLLEHPEGPVVVARSDSAAEVAARLGPNYTLEEFDLRPGVRLCLFLRRDRGEGAGSSVPGLPGAGL